MPGVQPTPAADNPNNPNSPMNNHDNDEKGTENHNPNDPNDLDEDTKKKELHEKFTGGIKVLQFFLTRSLGLF